MSKQRAKGTGFEVELLPLLRMVFGAQVERNPLKGIADDGDFAGCGVLVEAKKTDVPHFLQWCKTAQKKRPNGDWRIVWSGDRRKGDGPFVLLPLEEWLRLEADATPHERSNYWIDLPLLRAEFLIDTFFMTAANTETVIDHQLALMKKRLMQLVKEVPKREAA